MLLERKWFKKISVLFALVFVLNAVWAVTTVPTALAHDKEAKEEVEVRHNPDISTTNTVSRTRSMRLRALDVSDPVERHVDDDWTDGDSDDYVWGETAFSTISDAVSAASAGDTIVVHDGTYEEAVTVDKENLTIQAASDVEDFPTVNSQTSGHYAFHVTAPGVTIQGFNIVSGYTGIYLQYDTDAGYGATSATISDNEISGYDAGVYIDKITGELNITDNDIRSEYGDGMYIDVIAGGSVNISRNNVSDSGDYGIYIYTITGTNFAFNDNTVVNNGYEGVFISSIGSDSDDYADENVVEFTDNTITGNLYDGLYISSIDYNAEVTIEGNTIDNNNEEGLTIEYVGQEGDDYWDNSDYPDFEAPRIYVRDNSLCGNGDSGFYHYDDWQYGTEVTIEGNDISDNGEYGINQYYSIQYDSVLTIRDNQINDNAQGGIVWDYPIETGASYYVSNNIITGNGDGYHGGIYLYEVYDTAGEVEIGPNNIISGNIGEGIYLDYTVTGVRIWGNIIEGNYEGIWCSENAYNNQIVGNQIINNQAVTSGIHLDSSAGSNTANYNDLIDNGYGVYSDTLEPFDAALNWWNNIAGPGSEGADMAQGNITISPWVTAAYFNDDIIIMHKGAKRDLVLKADTMDSEGIPGTITVPERTVAFVSSDPDIVSIDEDGTVRGLRRGTATITALFANKPAIEVEVRSGEGPPVDRDDEDEEEDEANDDSSGDSDVDNDDEGTSEEAEAMVIKLTVGNNIALVDEEAVALDAPPYIQAATGRTMVPVRFVSEILGAEVAWNPQTQRVIITDGDKEIVLTIDSNVVLVDGAVTTTDSAPDIVSGRTFVGLRFVSEALGAEVVYDEATGQITITK